MKLFSWGKDGGPKSKVRGFWLIEIKKLFSVTILKFEGESREAYHTHAFNSINFVIWGKGLIEEQKAGPIISYIRSSLFSCVPFWVPRSRYHKVSSIGTTWVLSFRGPWAKEWKEYDETVGEEYTLTHGRIKT